MRKSFCHCSGVEVGQSGVRVRHNLPLIFWTADSKKIPGSKVG